jgi:hypothetical protein
MKFSNFKSEAVTQVNLFKKNLQTKTKKSLILVVDFNSDFLTLATMTFTIKI